MVIQEDRNLIMGGARVLEPGEDAAAVAEAARGFEPHHLGRFVLVGPRAQAPTWIYRAVVHDLEMSPTCRSGSVRRCLASILIDASKRGLTIVGTEPLGLWRRSGLDLAEMAGAFDEAIFEAVGGLQNGVRLTLLLREFETLEEVSRLLRSSLLRRASRSFHTVEGDAAVVEVRSHGRRYQFRFVPGALSGYLVTRSSHVG